MLDVSQVIHFIVSFDYVDADIYLISLQICVEWIRHAAVVFLLCFLALVAVAIVEETRAHYHGDVSRIPADVDGTIFDYAFKQG